MDDTIDKKEKVTSTNRRNNKPLMEKRRRQRINECLNQLKTLVLQALNKDSTQYSKLEKADILEMTVKHLKLVQRQQMTAAMATDPNVISKYRAGFNECAAEISRYLDTVNGGSPELKGRVLNYLSNSITQFPVIPVYQGVVPPYHLQMTSPMTSQHGFIPQYSQGAVMSNTNSNSAFVSQDYLQRSQHSSMESTQKSEQLRIPLHSDSLSHRTSPPRRVPSPCDSDSGLSDSSTSMSHDENGNYSHFNINHNSSVPAIKSEHDDSNFSKYLRNESDYTHALRKPTSPQKRSHTFPDGHASPKRHRPCDNFNQSEPVNMAVRQVAATESIWRPF